MRSGPKDQFASGQALAELVVAVATELQCEPLGDKRAKTLAAAAIAMDDISILRQGIYITPGDLTAEDGSKGTIRIVYLNF